MPSDFRFATRCIRAGMGADAYGAARPPIYHTTTFSPAKAASPEANTGEPAPLYTRYGRNPTLYSVERQLAAVEGADAALIFSAGIAAVSAACLALGRTGVVCVGNAYGGTLDLLTEQLPQLGIATALLAPDEEQRLEALLADGYGLVLVESPTNPDVRIQNLAGLAVLAHRYGGRLVVDNTFATPVNQQPLALGADLVVHSATKFLGGHSDLTAGAAMGPGEVIAKLDAWRRQLGQTPAPETASLLGRSLAMLEVRVQRQNASAQRIAEWLAAHPAVEQVHYPGLAAAPDHALAARQMTGFGGMLALDVRGGMEAATAVVERMRLFLDAPSLGGVESLVTQPARTSHAGISETERHRRGIPDSQIRLSVGLEDPEDLVEDLEHALACLLSDR